MHTGNFVSITEVKPLLCRLWDLNIAALSTLFTGATLSAVLGAWVNAKVQDTCHVPRFPPATLLSTDAVRSGSGAG